MKLTWMLMVATLVSLGAGLAPQDVYTLSDGRQCGPEGDAKNPDVKKVNRDKNRYTAPDVDAIDTDVTLAAMLAPGDDTGRFDEMRAARVVGFVVNVKVGGNETCNCHATKPIDRDTHIELALSPDAPENQRVIVEVTPRIRAKMKEKDVNWETIALQSHTGPTGIKGKWVEVTGWLLFDIEHTGSAENTNPGNPSNWRATCWELHPVTEINILDGPPANTPALESHTLRLLQGAHAKQLQRDPSRKQTLEARNKENHDKFEADEHPKDAR